MHTLRIVRPSFPASLAEMFGWYLCLTEDQKSGRLDEIDGFCFTLRMFAFGQTFLDIAASSPWLSSVLLSPRNDDAFRHDHFRSSRQKFLSPLLSSPPPPPLSPTALPDDDYFSVFLKYVKIFKLCQIFLLRANAVTAYVSHLALATECSE